MPHQLFKDNRLIVLLLFLTFLYTKDIQRNIRVSQKNGTDLKNSDTSCFKLIIEILFFSKSAIISLSFDIFFRISGDLDAELKINRL